MGIHNQGSRAVAFLQGMAGNVETILGHLDRIMGDHRRGGSHGLANRPIRLQDVSLFRYQSKWRVKLMTSTNFTCILPIMTQACCHFLYPIVLNPWCELHLFRHGARAIADFQYSFSNSRLGFCFRTFAFYIYYRVSLLLSHVHSHPICITHVGPSRNRLHDNAPP
jgi:hypothetical protein